MYNERFKKRFISALVKEGNSKSVGAVAPRYFNNVAGYEEGLKKDLSNFTIAEIIGMYKYVCTSSLEVLLQMQSLFKRYTYYCKDLEFVSDGINHYEEVTYDNMKACTNQRKVNESIITRKELLKLVSTFSNPSDSFLVLAIFEGISGTGMSDLLELKMENFDGQEVHLKSKRTLAVSKELLSYARESSVTYEYRQKLDRNNLYYKSGDKRILKSLCNVKENGAPDRGKVNLTCKLSRIKRTYECTAMTYGHLNESGRIDMIQSFMNQDNENDVRKTLSKHREEISERYGRIASYNRYLLKYSDYFKQ